MSATIAFPAIGLAPSPWPDSQPGEEEVKVFYYQEELERVGARPASRS
jgi:hypothetical protein